MLRNPVAARFLIVTVVTVAIACAGFMVIRQQHTWRLDSSITRLRNTGYDVLLGGFLFNILPNTTHTDEIVTIVKYDALTHADARELRRTLKMLGEVAIVLIGLDISEEGLEELSGCANLVGLTIPNADVSCHLLKKICDISSLRVLSIHNLDCKTGELRDLLNLRRLEVLTLEGNYSEVELKTILSTMSSLRYRVDRNGSVVDLREGTTHSNQDEE